MGVRLAKSARATLVLVSGLFLISGTAHGRVSEFTYEEPVAGFGRNERLRKLADVYEDIVLGVAEKSQVKPNPVPASNDTIGLELIVYGAHFGESAADPTATPPQQTVASWWSMMLIAAGLVFYQLRRPVRPRIGSF